MNPLLTHTLRRFLQRSGLSTRMMVGVMMALLLFSSVVSAAHIHELSSCVAVENPADCDSDNSPNSNKPVSDHFCPSCQLGDLQLADSNPILYTNSCATNSFGIDAKYSTPRGPPASQHQPRAPPAYS